MASTPLRPRQTAWGRACVVDTASNITPKRTAAKPPRAGATGGARAGPPRPARKAALGGSGYRDPGLAWIISCPLPPSSRPNLRDTLTIVHSPSPRLDLDAATRRPARARPRGGRAQGALRRAPAGRRAAGRGRQDRARGRVRGAGHRGGRARGDAGRACSRPVPGQWSRTRGAAHGAAAAARGVPGRAGADVPARPGRHRAAGQHAGRRAARLRPRVRGRQALHRVRGPARPGRGAKPARRGRADRQDPADPVPPAAPRRTSGH